jgi:hypothetical protein
MKNEITIPGHFPELSKEKSEAEAKRREKYSFARDLLANENNEAIARRLAKNKENESEDIKQLNSEDTAEDSQ